MPHVPPAPAARRLVPRSPEFLLFLLFAARLTFLAVLVPPWQNPDEPVHFAVIRTLAARPLGDQSNRRDVGVQAEILQSMAAHDWWKAYSEPVPDPPPREFLDRARHMGDASDAPALYYTVMAAFCRTLGVHGVLGQYYLVRILSLLTSLMTLWVIVRASREWFDQRVALLAGVLVAVVPQFALIGISVSPDPFVFLVGAVVWWQAARIANGAGVVLPMAVMAVAAVVAVLAKKLAMALLIEAPLLAAVALLTTRRRRIAAAGVTVAAVLVWAAGGLTMIAERVPRAGALAERYTTLLGWGGEPFSIAYFGAFTWRLFESAYLVAGWLRFHAWWPVVALAMILFIVLFGRGLVAGFTSDGRTRLAVAAALVGVGVQCFAIYGTMYYRPDWGAQGRFLFPAIGPFAVICALGLGGRAPASTARWPLPVFLGLAGSLDLIAWFSAAVPVYARWL